MLSPAWASGSPVDAAITQPWGPTDLTVEPWYKALQVHWHCGVDIGLLKGSKLFAARAGVCVYVGYGLVAIRVSPTEVHWFVHVDSNMVRVGEAAALHQIVAYSGDKVPSGGYLTGPHLHFERQSGYLNVPETSLDPMPVLTGAFSAAGGDLMSDLDQRIYDEERGIGQFSKLDELLGIGGVSTPAYPGLIKQLHDQIDAAAQKSATDNAAELVAIKQTSTDIQAALKALPATSGVTVDPAAIAGAVSAMLLPHVQAAQDAATAAAAAAQTATDAAGKIEAALRDSGKALGNA